MTGAMRNPMSSMNAPERSSLPDPRTRASRGRRIVHGTIAACVWALFVWAWWDVLGRTGGSEITFTAAFLSLSALVILLTTSLWVSHNMAVFQRKGQRRKGRERVLAPTADQLGRGVAVIGGRDTLRDAPIVAIALEGGRKVYRANGGERLATPAEREAA